MQPMSDFIPGRSASQRSGQSAESEKEQTTSGRTTAQSATESDDDAEMAIEEAEEYGIALPRKRTPEDYGRPRKGRHMSADLCLQFICEAMCKNEWERAAGLLASYFQTLVDRNTIRLTTAAEIVWRLGSEILLNHPKSTNEDINLFHETMKNIGVKNYLQISLEQIYHLLCSGDTDEVNRVVSSLDSWRYGQHSIKQNKLQKLIQAYRAVLNYRAWVERRSAVTENDLGYASQSSTVQAMGSYYRQATVAFQDIVQFPGVWDPFILNYVDLLESSGETEEAEKVLKEYAYNSKNPPNPNAHVYLYEFMKRNGAADDLLLKELRVLYSMTPSHKLMLKCSRLLDRSDSEDDQKLSLHVLFDLLDFSGWKKNVTAWSCLAKRLQKTFLHDRSAWILEAWQPRQSWWPSYHFTSFLAKNDWRECAKLGLVKAMVAGMLQGPGCVYFTCVYGSARNDEKTALRHMKKFIKMNNCGNIP
ncbi:TATA box-binding protein-associated factor RNA polymerase I subunit A isoform X1 [Bufo gargarizans]|uniref:TATA box-binding protein-associated factor RNA polymerase I subunit A isoform X1 n=2 Tax=Bufo gargarizans TaxID=30331 RepID=UPI001CF5339B|nr:TATA box-binding protein-associated factor RNA polymerase I subunit A isoform X1 [Bufo gargarizans]